MSSLLRNTSIVEWLSNPHHWNWLMHSKASLSNPKSLKFACAWNRFACHAKPSGVPLLARVPGIADPWHRAYKQNSSAATWSIAVPRADGGSCVTGLIRGWGRSRLIRVHRVLLTWAQALFAVPFKSKEKKMRKQVHHNFFVMKASCTCPIDANLLGFHKWSIDSQIKAEALKQSRIAVNCTKNKTGKLCFKSNKTVCDKWTAMEFYIMRHYLAVPRASDKFNGTGSIYGWNTSRLTYLHRIVADWKSISSLRSHPKPLLNYRLTIFWN